MTPRAPNAGALLAISIAGVTAFAAEAIGVVALAIVAAAVAVGLACLRGFAPPLWARHPRATPLLAGLYLPVFVVDLALSAFENPVAALGRLVVFLLATEILTGGHRPHRPLLFGLLLMVAAASQTTEPWFVPALLGFVTAAIASQTRTRLEPDASSRAQRVPVRFPVIAALSCGSLLLGLALFFTIPRLGAGWARGVARSDEASLESGLSSSVNLGVLGRVKARQTVAFRARIEGAPVEPRSLYWRARSYARWTGSGWEQEEQAKETALRLPANEPVGLAAEEPVRADLIATIRPRRSEMRTLLVPVRGVWIRTPSDTVIYARPDGALEPRGLPPRSYDVGAIVAPLRPEALAASSGEVDPVPPVYLDAGDPDPTVSSWAAAIAPPGASRHELARAFVAELSARAYSLDTRGIDSARPIASLLEGAPAHCEYFASAMALGLRLRGVPARVVGGFLGAERLPFDDDLTVRDSRAHLWVEVYFPIHGWVLFDPTPAAGRDVPAASFALVRGLWERAVVAWDTWVIGLDLRDQIDAFLGLRDAVARIRAHGVRGLSAGLLAVGAAVLLLLAREPLRRRFGRERSPGLPAFYRRFLVLARRRGLGPRPEETAREFAIRAGAAWRDPESVALLTTLYERERFGVMPPSAAESAAARRALERLRRRRPASPVPAPP